MNAPRPRWAPARLCAFRGQESTKPRGSMERIARRHDEADLPAQEASPRQGAWLPRPYEDDGWTPGPGRSPGSRSQAPVGLTAERGPRPPRLVMLSSPKDFAALTERGTYRSHPLLATRILRTDLGTTRFAFSTSRALGSAVVRNRVRRRLREALRSMAPELRPGWDVLVIARTGLVTSDYRTLVETLARLLRRAGVLGGEQAA
jgi:ribonuclease P protein component